MVGKIILLTYLVVCWSLCPALARDPNMAEPNYLAEPGILAGSEGWTFADTWVTCGVATMVVLLYALPRIFDGSDDGYPGFQNESRPGFSSLDIESLRGGKCRGDRRYITRLTVDSPLIFRGSRGSELSINPGAAHFKFPTRKSPGYRASGNGIRPTRQSLPGSISASLICGPLVRTSP